MDLLNNLQNLRLETLDYGWAKAVSQSEYLEIDDLPPEYENAIDSLELERTYMDIITALDSWLEAETEDNSWAYLSQTIDHMKLLALIGYYIDYGCKNIRTREYRLNALLAARFYFKLLRIPGYKSYNIYHSQLFVQSLSCLSFPVTMSDEENNYTASEITREINSVLKHLVELVKDLKLIIEDLHLTPNDMHFEEILSNCVETTAYGFVTKLHVDKILISTISKNIYHIIDVLLCKSSIKQHELALKVLFKCILPKLVASCMDNRVINKQHIRPAYVTYTFYIMANYAKPALSSYIILLEHLCYTLDGLEKTDVRENRAELITGMMSVLSQSSYKKITKWILQLSKNSKLPHRQLAVEVLAKLLANDHDDCAPTEQPTENNDAISPVVEDPNSEPQPSTSTAPHPTAEHNKSKPSTPETFLISDDNSQSSQESAEPQEIDEELNDSSNVLRARKHIIPHMEILRALYDRLHDESGTLRMRAIAILSDCLKSKRQPVIDAVKMLQGEGEVSRLTGVAARAVCDERAVVRKAGAALMLQLLLPPAAVPASSDLAMLVSLCRDGSLLVRQAAINALCELVSVKPSEAVIEAFLTGPVHQVSDPESKVQEQVLILIENLMIDRFRTFNRSGCDPLPWMILAGMVQQKMKMHLQKVCVLLSKFRKCLNHRLVDILSTHLGALNHERDLQCLLLLTSLARHVDYSDVGFVLDYYYKLVQMEEVQDVRLMSLTLELLSLWSRFLPPDDRMSLRQHIVRRLVEAQDDGCRILRAQLAAHLDPENLIWAAEMMQMSEQRAVMDGDVSEALRAADLSLVAPVPPSPRLLQVFLHAINDALPEWEEEQSGACVAGAARLCVRSRSAAESAAPTFAVLLARNNESLAVRINSLVALSDICARYTCIVEPLLGTMCDCLSKESPLLLRRRAARELTRLLLGEYLRLRTPLYYRYCALLADEDVDVREPAEYYVSCGLTTDTIYHHFVDCLLHYNHDEKDRISFDSRQLIYDVMLQRLSMVQRFNIQCRLAREVLEHAAYLMDEDDELSPAMNAALLDTITLLCGPRLKLPKKPPKASNNLEELQERVTTNIVSRKMKMTVAEVLVPAVIKLYSRMKSRGGQLTTYLLQLSTDLVKEYESEIEEVFEDDRELMKQVKWFQESIGMEPRLGNVRNLVTRSAPPEPDTPRSSRGRPRAHRTSHSPRKRKLRV